MGAERESTYTHLCISLGQTPGNGLLDWRCALQSGCSHSHSREGSFPHVVNRWGVVQLDASQMGENTLAINLIGIILFTSEAGSFFI